MSMLRTSSPAGGPPNGGWLHELPLPNDAVGHADTRRRVLLGCTTCETLLSRVVDASSLETLLATWWLRRTCPRHRAVARRTDGPAPAARHRQRFATLLTTMRAAR